MTLTWQLGYAERCFADGPVCGDGLISLQRDGTLRLMLADGIGHGPHAHRVVAQLGEHFRWVCGRSSTMPDLADCMRDLHQLLKAQQQTDQAAVALVDVNTDSAQIAGLSVGNVKVHSLAPGLEFSFPCLNGMVGGHLPRQLPVLVRPCAPEALLTLHSDGVSSRALLQYLGTLVSSGYRSRLGAQAVADAVLRGCGKTSDDASCAVVLMQQEPVA